LQDGEVHPVEDDASEQPTVEEPNDKVANREDIETQHGQEKEISREDDTSDVFQHATDKALLEDKDETLLDLWQQLTKEVTFEEGKD